MDAITQFIQAAIDGQSFSPSGSNKRKSRPTKRVIPEENVDVNDDMDLNEATPPPKKSNSEDLEADIHREEDEATASEVQSTTSEETMEPSNLQAEIFKKIAESINANSFTHANANLMQFMMRSNTDYGVEGNHVALNNLPQQTNFVFPDPSMAQTAERLVQAMFVPGMGFPFQHTLPDAAGLLTPNTNLIQSLMNPAMRKANDRINGNNRAVKRRLFADEEKAVSNGEDRIDMSDLEAFAQTFKKQRIKFGFTQGDVGVALGKRYGTDFSQTTISRFEALNLSFKNMCKLRPLLKEWLADIEAAIEGGASLNDLIEKKQPNGTPLNTNVVVPSEPIISSPAISPALAHMLIPQIAIQKHDQNVKRRRKRTNLDMNQRTALDSFFSINPRPDHDKMTEIANSLELERDVVRVWFCNRRQKMRRVDEPDSETIMPAVNPLFNAYDALQHLKNATKVIIPQSEDSDGASISPDGDVESASSSS